MGVTTKENGLTIKNLASVAKNLILKKINFSLGRLLIIKNKDKALFMILKVNKYLKGSFRIIKKKASLLYIRKTAECSEPTACQTTCKERKSRSASCRNRTFKISSKKPTRINKYTHM